MIRVVEGIKKFPKRTLWVVETYGQKKIKDKFSSEPDGKSYFVTFCGWGDPQKFIICRIEEGLQP